MDTAASSRRFFVFLLTLCAGLLALPGGVAHSQGKRKPMKPITDKTLVAWVTLANTTQRGGSALSLDNQMSAFDGIVLGEITPGKWMAGSDFYRRTPKDQAATAIETADPDELIQMALVTQGREVMLYRNGLLYSRHTIEAPQEFGSGSAMVFGLRHLEAGDHACFVGDIADARLYDKPLSADELRALVPDRLTGPKPLAWWTFADGKTQDKMGFFPPGKLYGGATIQHGRLHLPGGHAYMVAAQPFTRHREPGAWYSYHISALPDEGVCVPYDANGAIYWKGRYHLMYIYQDPTRPNGGHCWGHLSSTDLVNWTFHPPALVPDPGDADKGIFSGNAYLNKDGVPMLCWFGIDAGVCVATAEDDDLLHWKKHPKNPIIPIPQPGQPGHGVYTVWDPYLWLEGDTYYCLLGGNRLPNGKDTLYLCKSQDMVNWVPLHPFYEHPDLGWTETDEDCSCPDFFRLGEKYVLLCISHKIGSRCYIGQFENERFIPEQHVRMNWPGGMFFAPESLKDAKGRRIFWGWVTDPRVRPAQSQTGSGVMSLPREMTLATDGTLHITPVKELETLRRHHRTQENVTVAANSEEVLKGIQGYALELALEFAPGEATEVGLKVRCSPDSTEETGIWYDKEKGVLRIDMARSTLRIDVTYGQPPFASYGFQRAADNGSPYTKVEAPFQLKSGEALRLRVFLDGPLLEVFANGRQCMTQQIFPSRADSLQVKACAQNGSATVRRVEAWDMAPARFVNHKNETMSAGK